MGQVMATVRLAPTLQQWQHHHLLLAVLQLRLLVQAWAWAAVAAMPVGAMETVMVTTWWWNDCQGALARSSRERAL